MTYLVRMLERQKWERLKQVQEDISSTPADTITSELRTRSNTLSLWLISSLEEVSKSVLALALGRNKITRLDILVLDKKDYEDKGLPIQHTPENGLSPYTDYNQFHYDLFNMDYEKLGVFSQLIIDNVNYPEKCLRFDKNKISNILYDGYIRGDFHIEELDKNLQNELKKIIQNKSRT